MIRKSGKWPCGVCEKGKLCSVHSMLKNGFTNGAVVWVVNCRG